MPLEMAEGGLRFNDSKEKKMANRWVCRVAFVGLMMLSVAAMTGCRTMSHGRRSGGCGGCSDGQQPQPELRSEMSMEQSRHQH